MSQTVALGIAVTVAAGLIMGTSPWPLKLMRRFQYEQFGFLSMLIALLVIPWSITLATCPDVFGAIAEVDRAVLVRANLLSAAWGVAQVLAMLCFVRIGVSLTYGILCAVGASVGVVTPIKKGKPGFLSVTVNPPCDVYVDGKGIGISPIASQPVPPGSHNVRIVSRKDWLDRSYKVFIESDKSVERSFTFRKGKLTFVALPGTEIFIGKRKLGQTPMQAVSLYEGKYTFKVVDSQLGKTRTIHETVVPDKNKIVDIEIK